MIWQMITIVDFKFLLPRRREYSDGSKKDQQTLKKIYVSLFLAYSRIRGWRISVQKSTTYPTAKSASRHLLYFSFQSLQIFEEDSFSGSLSLHGALYVWLQQEDSFIHLDLTGIQPEWKRESIFSDGTFVGIFMIRDGAGCGHGEKPCYPWESLVENRRMDRSFSHLVGIS